MYDSVIVSFAQKGYNLELLVDSINDVIEYGDEHDLPILFTMHDFGDLQYASPWEIHEDIDIQGDYIAQDEATYEYLLEDLEISNPLVCGNLRTHNAFVNDGTTIEEASVDSVGETISITSLWDES